MENRNRSFYFVVSIPDNSESENFRSLVFIVLGRVESKLPSSTLRDKTHSVLSATGLVTGKEITDLLTPRAASPRLSQDSFSNTPYENYLRFGIGLIITISKLIFRRTHAI